MAVEIVGDPDGLLNISEFDCVVTTVPDYVPAVQRIKEAVANREPLQVLARNRACAVWLKRLAASYNDTDVRYSVSTTRDLLGERWQMAIPDYVTDEAILATGLLEAEIVPRAGQSFEDVVLEHYWGEFFTFVAFPTRLAGELIDSLEPERWRQNREHPLALRVLQARQKQWSKHAARRELKKLIRAVFESPGEIKRHLGRYKLLRNYPPHISQAVIGDWYTLFKNLQVDPTPVSLDALDLNGAIQEIQYYLNDLSPDITSQAEFKSVLDEMSGFLVEEFEWVLEQLRSEGEALQPTPELLRDVRNRFRPLRDQIEEQVAALEATIPPAYPSDPAKNASVDDWLHWAVSEYLPYRSWLEENNRWDETVAGYAVQYADWFYDNYITHRFQYQDRWVSNLLNQAGTSLSAGRKVLFILVDNFNFKYLETLTEQFQRRGFRVIGQVQPVWSPIPTTTEVSKWSLVAGEPELRDVQGNNYDDILQKDWQSHFRDYRVTYLARLGDLEKRRQFNEDLILLNYLPIDTVLHQDEKKIGTTHSIEIRGYIQALVDAVIRFVKRTKVERELDIYIASDHGSTKIPTDVGNEPDDQFYRKTSTGSTPSLHHRVREASRQSNSLRPDPLLRRSSRCLRHPRELLHPTWLRSVHPDRRKHLRSRRIDTGGDHRYFLGRIS